MALIFPLPLDDFWDPLPVTSGPPRLVGNEELSGLGSGRVLSARLATPLWRVDVTVAALTRAEEARFGALFDALDADRLPFLFSPKAHPWPAADPGGVILDDAAPEIEAVGEDNKSIALTGLPGGYPIRAGDFVSFQIGARWHLHRFVADVDANDFGVSGLIELRPHLRPGAAAGGAIQLVRPRCEMLIEPGRFTPGAHRGATLSGMTFSAVQKL